jgi:hypothetical protein
MCDAEDVIELLNSYDRESMLNNLAGMWKPSALEEAEETLP